MKQLLEIQAALVTDPPTNLDANFLAVKLIAAYAGAGAVRHAALVFSLLPSPNLFAWNTVIKAHAQHNLWVHTLRYFCNLFHDSAAAPPDEYTFTSVLKACGGLGAAVDGDKAHSLVLKMGLHANIFVQNSLIDMCFKLDRPSAARRLFDEMPKRDTVSWNTVVSGLSLTGDVHTARRIFNSMGSNKTLISWSAMIAGYARSGETAAARNLFDQMPQRNVASWNVMISAYAQNDMFMESVELFRRMQQPGADQVPPNEVTLVVVLSTCAHLGALVLGRWIDGYAQRKGFPLTLFLGNALVDMYAKCGCISDAGEVFNNMAERDVVSWTILISGLATNGLSGEALVGFREMLRRGVQPNELTFMAALSACTHGGLVDAGLSFFHMMAADYRISPKVEHYGCVVDLLSRAGRLDEAEKLVAGMKIPANVVVWGALLGGCRTHGDVRRGERVVRRILELEPEHSGGYVYLANAYAMAGRAEDAALCRANMQQRQVEKVPGCSWIEMGNAVHEFFMGDRTHPESERIYAMIRELGKKMREMGYEPNTRVVAQSIEEEEKEEAVAAHSEKLAVAFGLISSPEGTTIRVVKNLRVCDDCHEAMKIISMIARREIVLRDRCRFHHFRGGFCSCNDFW